MKDSVWIYIKESLLSPVLFVIEVSAMPLYKPCRKRKYKKRTF